MMEKVKETGAFDMPSADPSGAPLDYFFGKSDPSGIPVILYPKIGQNEKYLEDYNVENGDSLEIIFRPIPGAII